MTTDSPENLLSRAAVRPTANRILVVRALAAASAPMSLIELEQELITLDRSSISRVLSLLASAHLVHALEDGRGITKYELCHADHDCSLADQHAHFYCEKCNRVFCFESVAAPVVPLPEGFTVNSVNFMLKGLCPDCSRSR